MSVNMLLKSRFRVALGVTLMLIVAPFARLAKWHNYLFNMNNDAIETTTSRVAVSDGVDCRIVPCEATVPPKITIPTASTAQLRTQTRQPHQVRQEPYKRADKRAFVCITGQLGRLELENKIRKLFLPLQKAGYTVDVALSLSTGETSYTNGAKSWNKWNKKVANTHTPLYEDVSQIVQELSAHDVNVISPHVYPKLKSPPFNLYYFISLYKAQRSMREPHEHLERSLNHARTFDSYQRCWNYTNADNTTSTHDPTGYDLYSRIREDVGFVHPLPRKVINAVAPNSVVASDCRAWGGMNDRFALVSPEASQTYFLSPYKTFKTVQMQSGNPERFLKRTFQRENVTVVASPQVRGVVRIYHDNTGKPQFHKDDLLRPRCPDVKKANKTISSYGLPTATNKTRTTSETILSDGPPSKVTSETVARKGRPASDTKIKETRNEDAFEESV